MENFKYETDADLVNQGAPYGDAVVEPEKKWVYAERAGKIQQDHVITVTKKRFTHTVTCADSKSSIYKRTDINLENVHSVSSFYATSRPIGAVIALAIFAAFFLILGFTIGESQVNFAFLGLAVIFGLIAFFISRMTTNVFHLEITTVGELSSDALSHGGALPAASGTRRSPVAIILPVILLVLFVIGMASGALQDFIGDLDALAFLIPLFFVLILIFAFARSAGGSAKGGRSMGTGGSYVLAMSEKTGKEIVETLGDFIIDK